MNIRTLQLIYCGEFTITAKREFVQFIKHILGIEILETFPETVSKAFDEFIAIHSLSFKPTITIFRFA